MTDRQLVYEHVKTVIVNETTMLPNKPALSERAVRQKLVADGQFEVDEYETALSALQEQDKIVCAGGWVTPVLDDRWLRDAIEWVIERDDDPAAFVGACNRHM
jgi:GMP synthase-like glutamine amidotransferase